MAKRRRPPGQCSKCGTTYPETDEFFHTNNRRGRTELRSVCKACAAKSDHSYRQKRVEAIRQYNRERAQTPRHREIIRKAQCRFRAKPDHREIDRAQYRRDVSTPEGRERIRVKARRRRAIINGSTRHHTAEDVRLAKEVQGNRCFYCPADVSTTATVDHLIPLIRGGSDGPENIVIACPTCNFRKADRTPEEFALGVTHRRRSWRKELLALLI